MTWALVQNPAAVVETGNYDGSISASFSSNPAVGNLIVVTGGGGSQSATYAVSDNKGNTYTVRQSATGQNYSVFFAWAIVASTGASFTVTVTEAGQRDKSIKVMEFSGGVASGIEDVYTIPTQTSNAPFTVSGTSTAVGDLLVSVFGSASSITLTSPPTGYTSLMAVNGVSNAGFARTVASAYKIAGAAGTESATWPDYSAGNQVALLVGFKAGASGPTVTGITAGAVTEAGARSVSVTLSAATTATTAIPCSLAGSGTDAAGSGDLTLSLNGVTCTNGVTCDGTNFSVPSGVSGWSFNVQTTADTLDEADETATITIGGQTATITITDDDPLPTITGTAVVTVNRGESVVITVSLNAVSGRATGGRFTLTDGTKVGGTDYTNVITNGMLSNGVTISAGVLSIPAGVTSFTITIPTAA